MRPLPLLAALLLAPLAPLAAQQTLAAGRVVRITATDTVPAGRVQVMLHRVARDAQGPLDSTFAGPDGRFRFRYRADTTAIYLVSAGWDGIEYFSSPLHTNAELPDTALQLVVSDTSSAATVSTVSRHIVVSKPGTDGIRPVLEIVVIANHGITTRISPDTLHPSWAAPLPRGVAGFTAGSGDFSSEAMTVRNDSVMVFAPIAPGEKQLLYTYALAPAPGPVRLALRDSVGTFNVLLEERDRSVKGGAIVVADTQVIEGRTFRQWTGPVPAGTVVVIDFPGSQTDWVLPALVAGVALALVLVAVRSMRRRPAQVPVVGPSLLDQLARLDARYASVQDTTPEAEWAAYQAERTRLKAALQAELAPAEKKA